MFYIIHLIHDEKNRLKGRLSLKDLITANSKDKVKDIFIPKVSQEKIEFYASIIVFMEEL